MNSTTTENNSGPEGTHFNEGKGKFNEVTSPISSEHLSHVETRIHHTKWSALIYDPLADKSEYKAHLTLVHYLNDNLKEDSIAYPSSIERITPDMVESAIFQAMLESHFSISDLDSQRSKDQSVSVSVVYMHRDVNGYKTAVIGHEGPHTRPYIFNNGEMYQLSKETPNNYIGMPEFRIRDKEKGDVVQEYKPTVFSVYVPDSAYVFSLSRDVFDLFSQEEIIAFILKIGNIDEAVRRLTVVAKDPERTPLQKVHFIRHMSK